MLDERIVGRAGVLAYDPLRLVVDVRGTGATGHRIAGLMREQDDIDLELFAENVVVARLRDRRAGGARPASGWSRRSSTPATRLGEDEEEPRPPFADPPPWGPTEMSPREAFLAGQEVVPFDEAEGRIAAESLAAYPPGVPNVLPGERLTGADARLHRRHVAHGGLVRGASDRTLKTVRVVARMTTWGADSEYGRLRDVLLCPPDNFRWLPTSAISKATLDERRAASTREPALAPARRAGRRLRGGRRRGATSSSPTRRCPTRCSPATRA